MKGFLMEIKINLEPCPFCGGGAVLESWSMSPWERMNAKNPTGKWYSVFCNACYAAGPDCTTDIDAAAAWNKRV